LENSQRSFDAGRVGRFICFYGWLVFALMLALSTLSILLHRRPVHAGDVDITHWLIQGQIQAAIWTAVGLGLAVAALMVGKLSGALVVASSGLYLLRWYPFATAFKRGYVEALQTLWLVVTNGADWPYGVVRSVLLPLAFVVSIGLVVWDVLSNKKA
jgi:hypothetical protein